MNDGTVTLDLDPATWLREQMATIRRGRFAGEDLDALLATAEVVTLDDITGDGPRLRAEFDRLVELGTPPQAAAHYLAGWYAGALGELIGVGIAAADAGFVVEPSTIRWTVHADGWPISVDAEVRAIVPTAHPWASTGTATVVSSSHDATTIAVSALVDAVRPIIDACAALTKVGRVGLWNEVSDTVGMVLAFQTMVDPTDERVARLRDAGATAGTPWRAAPRLWSAGTGRRGAIHLAQKGGCCLAYTEPEAEEPLDIEQYEGYHRAYLERFPRASDDPHYCTTCSLRDRDDCEARQLFWHEHHPADPPG
jgi:hypothetical protein